MQIQKKITRIKYRYQRRCRIMNKRIEMLKFVPFLMNNFVDFVEDNKFEAETFYLKRILQKKTESERYYTIKDLIFIFGSPQLKNLRLLWKLFLRKRIPQIIITKILSKKMQIVYQDKVDHYIFLFNLKDPYKYQVIEEIQVNTQINDDDYPLRQSIFQQQLHQLLCFYINEDQSDTMNDPTNFLAIIDIIKYLHDIEEFYVQVTFFGLEKHRITSLRIVNLKQYIYRGNYILRFQND